MSASQKHAAADEAVLEAVRRRYFPMKLPAGVVARPVDRATLRTVWETLSPRLFPHDDELRRFRTPPDRESGQDALKSLYSRQHRERIVLYDEAGDPIGFSYGQMEDYLTYYMHTMGLAPAYRGKGIYTAYLRQFADFIGALGYERITSHHQPNNRAVLIGKLKAGYMITGMELDESFGLLIKMAYFIHRDREEGFEDVFSLRPAPERE